MFAVPGWSVSSSALRTQSTESSKPAPISTAPVAAGNDAASKPSKKRKRSNGKSKASDVNATNLADLWETVIEGKEKPKVKNDGSTKHAEKKPKIVKEVEKDASQDEAVAGVHRGSEAKVEAEGEKNEKKKLKTPKDKSRAKKAALKDGDSTNLKSTSTSHALTTEAAPPPSQVAPVLLTPLQASMRQKLISARFRYLNQTLYTTPSAHSLSLFHENPEMFTEYHEGFRRQVEVWPENPVSSYITQIKERGQVRGAARGKGNPDVDTGAVLPLPRTEGVCTVADLGCGDAGLASGLQESVKKLKMKIHSFDLQSPSPLVTKADIANLPLADGSVDVAIFCLALMGTNWVDFIEESYRILRWKGELWVAEIKSRFGREGGKKGGGRVEHSVGNRVKKPLDKKDIKKMEQETDDAVAAVEVDGQESTKGETDVSAFVEVLRKRGFVLQGEVDLRNRMFVKMCFVKGATPIKGKGVPVPKGMAEMGLETWKKKPSRKFVDEEEIPVSSEAGVLKPCVYKLR